jgi:hypothetical protein
VVAKEKPGVGRRLPRGHGAVGYGFHTAAGEAPGAALVQLGRDWPVLRLVLRQARAPGVARADGAGCGS